MRYRYLLFDADGTLMDFDDAEHQAFQRTFQEHDLVCTESIYHCYQQINSGLWKKFEQDLISKQQLLDSRFALLFEQLNLTGLDPVSFNQEYLYNLGYGSRTLPHALETCQTLSRQGYRIYILTNGVSKTQRRRLSASGLMPLLSDIFVSEDAGHQKPRREYFDYVFTRIPNFAPEQALMIGDSLSSDMEGARRANIDRCWYNPQGNPLPGTLPIQYQIRSLDELPKLLAQL